MTVLIPLIGYMVIFNEYILPYLQLSKAIFEGHAHIGEAAHVSARLIAIYFGLCFLGMGSLTYQLACPAEVKRFGTAPDYISTWLPHMGEVSLRRIESRLEANSASKPDFVGIRDREQLRLLRSPRTALDDTHRKYWPDVLEIYFEYLDETRWIARIFVFLCDSLGLIFLAIPSAEVFYRVTTVAVQTVAEQVLT
jgi:hypothetical protein